MKLVDTLFPEVKVIEPTVFGDERGFFYESFHGLRYQALVPDMGPFVQDNVSQSSQHVLRGLHFQSQHMQAKLISVLKGAVFDVVVDVRVGSPHFGQHIAIELSEANKRQLWVPKGFAHGFLVLSEVALFGYKVTDYYHPQSEQCLAWDDPALGIAWPLVAQVPQLSSKDQQGKRLAQFSCEQMPCYQEMVC
jgi:dTDP-4-dehydrorhamnose 3,5-epimerase